jgi:hypothetical protein
MGEVWEAERADGQFEQIVALKLLKRGMDSEEVLRRFLRERQILARLEHSSIARLFDGGLAPDGRPYLVLDGRPVRARPDEGLYRAGKFVARRRLAVVAKGVEASAPLQGLLDLAGRLGIEP